MTFGTFLLDALFIFFFVVWFWILIRVLMDLFRRKDISGVAKVLWVIFLVVLPYIGIFAYLLTQGWSMGERDVEQARGRARAAPECGGLQRRRRDRQARQAEGGRLDHRGGVQDPAGEAHLTTSGRRARVRRLSRGRADTILLCPRAEVSMSDVRHTRLLIIGSGPAGYTAAVYGRARC